MTHYIVEWVIDAEADTPEEAAQQAWDAVRRRGSTATLFTVREHDGDDATFDVDVGEYARSQEHHRASDPVNQPTAKLLSYEVALVAEYVDDDGDRYCQALYNNEPDGNALVHIYTVYRRYSDGIAEAVSDHDTVEEAREAAVRLAKEPEDFDDHVPVYDYTADPAKPAIGRHSAKE